MRFLVPLLLISAFAPLPVAACSAITIVLDGKVILAHNNDNSYARDWLLRVTPARDGLFGRACISLETVPGWAPMGMKCMNEKGLAITHANVPRSSTPYDAAKPQFRHNFLEKIVAECETVAQAVAMVGAYSLPPGEHGAHVHLMLADRTGESAVIEWADGETKVISRSGPTQIMTNFLLSKPDTAGTATSRYARGRRMLDGLKSGGVDSAVAVLKEISIHAAQYKGDEVGSVESAVFDLTEGKVYLYYKRDFDHPFVFRLDEKLAEGERTVHFRTLFPNPVPFEPGDRYEDGPVKPKASGGGF